MARLTRSRPRLVLVLISAAIAAVTVSPTAALAISRPLG